MSSSQLVNLFININGIFCNGVKHSGQRGLFAGISHATSKILGIKIPRFSKIPNVRGWNYHPKAIFKNKVKMNSKFGISWILTAGHCMQNGLHTVYPDRIRIQVRFPITILGSQLRSKIYIDKKSKILRQEWVIDSVELVSIWGNKCMNLKQSKQGFEIFVIKNLKPL